MLSETLPFSCPMDVTRAGTRQSTPVRSASDVTLYGVLGGSGEHGWDPVGRRLDWASTQYADGALTIQRIASYVDGNLGYVVQLEKVRFNIPGHSEESLLELRATWIFRRERDGWRIAHRHADSQLKRQDPAEGKKFAADLGVGRPERRPDLVPRLTVLVGQTPNAQDEAIWQQFEAWVAELPALAPGDSVPFRDRYVASLVQQGMARNEAERRYDRILVIRHGSVDRERVYWDGAFKSGAGPDNPLRLLQETISKLKPGRALDAGMGRGRNSIFLASVGWETTGYDISAEALKAARAYAEKAGVKIRTVKARHDTFPFGEAQWDLSHAGHESVFKRRSIPAVIPVSAR
jgi:hypothetical protein